MSDYDVGFGKPPKETRFKPGQSGNPRGRPKRNPVALIDSILEALNRFLPRADRRRLNLETLYEYGIKRLVDRAVGGDLAAAGILLDVRAKALKFGNSSVEALVVEDWLPDYQGQTADQKTHESAATADTPPTEWWNASDTPQQD